MFRNPRFGIWPSEIWRTLCAVWGCFWMLMIYIAIADGWTGDGSFRWWRPLVNELSSAFVLSVVVYLVLDHGMRLRHLLSKPRQWLWGHFKWLPAMSACFVVFTYGLRHGIYALVGVPYEHEPWITVWIYETFKLAIILGLWVGVFFGIHAFVAAREQHMKLQTLQRSLTEARLRQLKAQLEPHFLFNTLNTISALMHSDVAAADHLLNQLGDLLRARLTLDDRQVVPLEEELRLLRLYAGIMCTRFTPRVAIHWDIDNDTLAVAVPMMLLQPLLENVFRHEVEITSENVQVCVEARMRDEVLEVTVRNSVSSAICRIPPGSGIGLQNSRERLQALYGSAATLTSAREGSSFGAILRVPERVPELGA